jgi:hypothetical protein
MQHEEKSLLQDKTGAHTHSSKLVLANQNHQISFRSSLKYGLAANQNAICGNYTREQRIDFPLNYVDNLKRLNCTNYKLSYLPRPSSATLCVQPTASQQSRPAIRLHQNLLKQYNCETKVHHFNQLALIHVSYWPFPHR